MVKRLVLLPGMDGTGELFANFVAALPADIEPIVIGYPGREQRSYVELLRFVRDETSVLDPYVVLGESFSSALAVQFAALRPPNLRGLILCVGFATNPLSVPAFLLKPLVRTFLFRFEPPEFVIDYFLGSGRASPAVKAEVRRVTRLVSPAVLAGRAREILGCDVREELSRVDVPVLYLQASEDHLVGKKNFEKIRRVKKSAVLVSIAGPHLLLQTEPHACASAVAQFCSSTEGAGGERRPEIVPR